MNLQLFFAPDDDNTHCEFGDEGANVPSVGSVGPECENEATYDLIDRDSPSSNQVSWRLCAEHKDLLKGRGVV